MRAVIPQRADGEQLTSPNNAIKIIEKLSSMDESFSYKQRKTSEYLKGGRGKWAALLPDRIT